MKAPKKIIVFVSMLMFFLACLITACKKEMSSTSTQAFPQQLSVYLTDDPSPIDSLFIDIKYVEVKVDTSENHRHDDHFGDNDNDRDDDHQGRDQFGKWDTLNIIPGTYNLSTLRNGIDTLLGTANINGTIRKVRITLGSNNALVLAGVRYPLNLVPGINNYLYVKINDKHHHETASGKTSLWLDFDISRSIIPVGGQYFLRPALRPFCDNNFAIIKGKVLPAGATPLVSVFNDSDTANAIPRQDGEFKIRGLTEGTYKVTFKGFNGYRDTTLLDVQLKKGEEKLLTTVILKK